MASSAVVSVKLDRDAGAAYLRLNTNSVARTVEFSEDIYVDLDAMGVVVGVELLDLTDYPGKLTLTLAFEGGERRFQLRRPGEGQLDLDAVRAVWWRRPGAFGLPETVRDQTHRRLALSETATAFHGLFAAMDARWINPPALDASAGHKPYQLALAQSLGLEIPQTMMTSDPEEAREFWRACDGDVIYKQFLALPDAWSETRRLGQVETKAADDAIRLAPVIFQRRVAAVADLRVTIIGDDVFAASVDVRDLAYDVDVRLNLNARHIAHDLPDDGTMWQRCCAS